MSSKSRRSELRRERDAAYEAECEKRDQRRALMESRFGDLRARLEELGVDPHDLAAYLDALRDEA